MKQISCPSCHLEYLMLSEQAICIEYHNECVVCRFTPSKNGTGEGTDEELKSISEASVRRRKETSTLPAPLELPIEGTLLDPDQNSERNRSDFKEDIDSIVSLAKQEGYKEGFSAGRLSMREDIEAYNRGEKDYDIQLDLYYPIGEEDEFIKTNYPDEHKEMMESKDGQR